MLLITWLSFIIDICGGVGRRTKVQLAGKSLMRRLHMCVSVTVVKMSTLMRRGAARDTKQGAGFCCWH